MSEATGDLLGLATLMLVTCVAAAVNSVAGGGTILTFPALVAILPPDPGQMVVANATSTIGLWPGSLASAYSYRSDRAGQPPWGWRLVIPSVAGAIVGAVLVVVLPPEWFRTAVPWLILTAAVLFTLQPWIVRTTNDRLQRTSGLTSPPTPATWSSPSLLASCLQFLIAVYGGYFGAGIGILMLAALGLVGVGDIHRLNAVKNALATVINGAAAGLFAVGAVVGGHEVSWPHAAAMAVAAVIGGFGGSQLARRMPAAIVRRGVAIIAFLLAGYYFVT